MCKFFYGVQFSLQKPKDRITSEEIWGQDREEEQENMRMACE